MNFSHLNINYYNDNDIHEAENQLSKTFLEIHSWWYKALIKDHINILDIGSGAGRDAEFLASEKHQVTCIEPSQGMRRILTDRLPEFKNKTLDDTLPELRKYDYGKYDLIICSSVFHLIPPESQFKSLLRMAELLKEDGTVVISLKHMPKEQNKNNYPTEYNFFMDCAQAAGLHVTHFKPTHDNQDKHYFYWSNFILKKALNS